MSDIGQIERTTQNRIIKYFVKSLGYEYLGNWENRENNSNIEESYLRSFLEKQGYSSTQIDKAISVIRKAADNQVKSLYDINKEIYSMLRYGIKVSEINEHKQTVYLIDWENPLNNQFAVAEEVTVNGQNTKRPDIVIYVNGIALGVLELKRSKISISEGIRQNIDNQKKIFIQNFFATVQYVMAGNDSEYLKYGTIDTPEKYYLKWKEDKEELVGLEEHISHLLNKERFLELIHDFVVYDRGNKKLARPNQYFGVKATQESIKQRDGGIFWHTQGSGKSLSMVWIAKWIKENITDSRVLIITDRTELDEQIEKVFKGVEEQIYRTKSGSDLITALGEKEKSLICTLVHKFGGNDESDEAYDEFIEQVKASNLVVKGDMYVFVDECHRTQSGKLHDAMKFILPDAVFIGFTGTPLLKKDKKKSLEVFGKYIHTYKFDEAVTDGVVLDLRYEARDIDQKITSQDKIDAWFDAKTKGLTDVAKSELKKKWGTMQKVFSSTPRLNKIISDILLDFETKPRLSEGSGNAMLVAGSIYEACRYYELFQEYGFKKCAIITSYNPTISSIKGESTGEDEKTNNIIKYETYQKMLADWFNIPKDKAVNKIQQFEEEVKEKFIDEPGQMKLLIVVDKLLTGFDAPSATYLYIDKTMQDHALFQAICRVNRLDGASKDYGYIIDYKDLFKKLENAVEDYTSGAFDTFEKEDVEGLLKDRLTESKKQLDEMLEKIKAMCEGVSAPKNTISFIKYFVGNQEEENAQRRQALYKTVSSLIRAYANIANEMEEAGYSQEQQVEIAKDVAYYTDVRDEIKLASGDYIDLKLYEPAMRHLIDSYISADESKIISVFEDTTLLELIVTKGISAAIDQLPKNISKEKEAVAETIEGNIRKLITDEREVNPIYFERMSLLLDELVKARKSSAIAYQEYLQQISELIAKLKGNNTSDYPASLPTKASRSLYDFFNRNESIALKVNEAIIKTKRDDWRGNKIKEREIKNAVLESLGLLIQNNVLADNVNTVYGVGTIEIEELMKLIKNQNEY